MNHVYVDCLIGGISLQQLAGYFEKLKELRKEAQQTAQISAISCAIQGFSVFGSPIFIQKQPYHTPFSH